MKAEECPQNRQCSIGQTKGFSRDGEVFQRLPLVNDLRDIGGVNLLNH